MTSPAPSISVSNITIKDGGRGSSKTASFTTTLYKHISPGGALPINGLMGMCRWMGSHFHDWTDYNGVAFSSTFYRVTRMGSHFSGILRVRKFRQVVIYKRKDSPKRKSYRIHCCCLIFDKRLPLSD